LPGTCMATQAEIDECYEVAVDLAKKAGAVSKLLLLYYGIYSDTQGTVTYHP